MNDNKLANDEIVCVNYTVKLYYACQCFSNKSGLKQPLMVELSGLYIHYRPKL